MTAAKKDLLKNVLLTVAGLLPVVLLGNSKNWLVIFIQIAGVLMAAFNFILIFSNLQFFLDEIFPAKTFDDKSKNTTHQMIIVVTNVFFFCGAIAMIFEINKIDNTIHGLNFFFVSGATGIFIALLVMLLIKRACKTIYDDSTRRYTVFLGLPMAFLMLFPAIGSFVNRQFAEKDIHCRKVIVQSKGTDSRNRQCYLFCDIEDRNERFVAGRAFYETVIEGREIELCVQKGGLGYEFVRDFKLSDLPN